MNFWPFKKESPEERAQKERDAASIRSLESGGLPTSAREKIGTFLKHGKLFTSDLSCNEFLLTEKAGYEPIRQVMGSAFVNVSIWGLSVAGRTTGELKDNTEAMMKARRLAISRLKQEAHLLGAHGVISVELKTRKYDWAANLIEVTAMGTAIKIPNRPVNDDPFTSHLSGQDFWKLYESGYWPLSLVMGASSYYVFTDPTTRNQLQNFWGFNNANNQEIKLYTQSFNDAYRKAMWHITMQAVDAGAEGVVGTTIRHDIEDIEYERMNTTHHDLLLTITCSGTAIKSDHVQRTEQPFKPLMIMDLRRGSKRGFTKLAREDYDMDLSSPSIDDYDDEE